MSYSEIFNLHSTFHGASLSKIDKNISNSVVDWLRSPKFILFLRGAVGCGKTYLMAAILNEKWGDQIKKHKTVRYYYEKKMLVEIREKIRTNFDPMAHVEKICQADFLMIDDFGCSKQSDFTTDVWESIADERLNNGEKKPTIISSNLTDEEMLERFGERTVSRMMSNENKIIVFANRDRRRGVK